MAFHVDIYREKKEKKTHMFGLRYTLVLEFKY